MDGAELQFEGFAVWVANEQTALKCGPILGDVSNTATFRPYGIAIADFENEYGTLEFSFFQDGTLNVAENGMFGRVRVSVDSGNVSIVLKNLRKVRGADGRPAARLPRRKMFFA